MFEDALIARRIFPIDMGRWVIEERWDLHNPSCPVIVSPYHSQLGPKDIYVKQSIITAMKYREMFGMRGHQHFEK